ncbi:MAG: hypothetical protein AAGG68_03315 [Bacteroidota bacterium]
MNLRFKVIVLCLSSLFISESAQAQVNLRKLRQKAERAIDKAVDKAIDKELGLDRGNNSSTNSTNNSDNPSAAGRGTKLTPPDVSQHIADANTAVASKNYTNAKFEIQQAILGVELEIGYKILENLPSTVNSMSFDENNDQVSSSGYGFVGFTVGRSYEGNNKVLNFSVVSNNVLISAYSSMMTNASYSSSEGEQKTVNIDGNRGVLRFENGNYELGIPLGQTSIIVFDCDGFADENEVLNAAKLFKINEIKQLLGEQ